METVEETFYFFESNSSRAVINSSKTMITLSEARQKQHSAASSEQEGKQL